MQEASSDESLTRKPEETLLAVEMKETCSRNNTEQTMNRSKKHLDRYIYKTLVWILMLCVLGILNLVSQYLLLVFKHHPSSAVLSTIMLELASELRPINMTRVSAFPKLNEATEGENSVNLDDLCSGRYVYMYDLPSRFNKDILENCSALDKFNGDLCPYVSGTGLGPLSSNSEGILQDEGWYLTNQFVLDIIFHHKMKHYECLTKNSSLASAIFVPFYAGLDVAHLQKYNMTVEDDHSVDLAHWLASQPEMKYMNGRDHFLVDSRVTGYFRKPTDYGSWGNELMQLPEITNMTILTVESTNSGNDFAVPYPTSFHPSTKDQVLDWQKNVLDAKRHYLFSFIGVPSEQSIQSEITSQCLNSSSCRFLDCSNRSVVNCYNPTKVMRVLKNSTFCLFLPPGDTATRRSTFDSIVAGCIPVFFSLNSAFSQYKWHLPEDNYSQFSVYISEDSVKTEKLSIEKILLGFSKSEIRAMREEVTRLIPNVIYSDPRFKLDGLEDAFDIAVARLLERVEKMRKEIEERTAY